MEKKTLLSTLWIFLVVNFMFCDIFTLMHSADLQNLLSGKVGEILITQEFLLTFAILMEIPMIMILLSRILPSKSNRVANIIAGVLMTIIQTWSLTVGKTTMHYSFFSLVEIATSISIVWLAFKWNVKQQSPSEVGEVLLAE